MQVEAVAEELRTIISKQRRLDPKSRLVRALGRLGPRLIRWPRAEGATVGKGQIDGVKVRTYTPHQMRSSVELLWVHGGGMVMGAPPMDDLLLTETAADLGIRITSIDYRLAPEHPFPIPLDDCMTAWRATVRRIGADARVVIGGQSAGGGLAAALVQRIHDTGATQPLAQWLLCPMLDDRTAADRSLDDIDHFVWNNATNRSGWRALLSQEPGAATVPQYSVPARRRDLSGLPKTWIGVGDIDLFHAEDVAYGNRLRSSGVDVTLEIVDGAPHGFEALVPDAAISREYRGAARRWLSTVTELYPGMP